MRVIEAPPLIYTPPPTPEAAEFEQFAIKDYVRTLLEKITVYDDHIIVEFKSGIEIQIDKEI